MDDLVKLKCDYFDDMIQNIQNLVVEGDCGDYLFFQEYEFNIIIKGELYELNNGAFLDGYNGGAFIQPVKCYENPYNIRGKEDGIYYKGFKVGDLMNGGNFLRTIQKMGYKKCGENSWKHVPDWLISIAPITTITIIDDFHIKVEELYTDNVNNPTITEFSDYQKCIDYLS